MRKEKSWTYAKAGVDIDKVSILQKHALSIIENLSQKLKIPVHGLRGRFTTFVEINGLRIALHVDGVGTKVLVAQLVGSYWQVGQDVVAMNVNDLVAGGADPFAIVDYLAMEKPDEEIFTGVMKGISSACEEAKVVLMGGETAIMPDVVKGYIPGKGFDLVATGMGIVKWNAEIGSENDVLIGFESNGIHSNGLSLARKVLLSKYKVDDPFPYDESRTIGEELLRPTRIYVNLCRELWERRLVKNFAHITGGAFRKIKRVLKEGLGAILNVPEPPPIFKLIKEEGNVPWDEMYRTFNMGIGMVAITTRDNVDEIISIAKKFGIKAFLLGRVIKGDAILIRVESIGEVRIS